MTAIRTLILSAILTACTGTSSPSYATPSGIFPTFPEECARRAHEQLQRDYETGAASGTTVTDSGAWEQHVYRVTSTYGDMLAPSAELLAIAESNQTKPRVSNQQSRKAGRILRKYAESVFYRTPVLKNTGAFSEKPGFIHYRCLSETCPPGALCVPLYLHQEGQEFRRGLGLYRRLFHQAMTWARETQHLKRKVPQLIKSYNQAEKELVAALQELPDHIYVIDAYIAHK